MVEGSKTLHSVRVAERTADEIRAEGRERLKVIKEQWRAVKAKGLDRNADPLLYVVDWPVLSGAAYFSLPENLSVRGTPLDASLAFLFISCMILTGTIKALGDATDILSTHMTNKVNLLTAAKFARNQVNAELRFAGLIK